VTLRLPDVSHYQGSIDWAKVGPAAIIKCCESTTYVDTKWAANSAGAEAHCQWWGAYQFLRPTDDPRAAARYFKKTLGKSRPNVVVLDLELGTGDQSERRRAWLAEMADFPATAWTYSGLSFQADHNLGRIEWVAAYRAEEPPGQHLLWQYTSNGSHPGIGRCDMNLYHGSVADLIAATEPKAEPHPPTLRADGKPHPAWTRKLQGKLHLAQTGRYDKPTQAAVKKYKRAHLILPPTRTAGRRVWKRLGLWS